MSRSWPARSVAASVVATLALVPAGAAAAVSDPQVATPGATTASRGYEGSVAGQAKRPELQRALDAVVAAGVPGAMARVRDEDGVWSGASGVANIYRTRPPKPDSRFRIGSVTKTFVATLVLQLVHEDKVALDAPVERYLPGIIPGDQHITVRQLMNHTSGIYDYDVDLVRKYGIRGLRFQAFSPRDLVRVAMRHEPQYQPGEGERWYSNTNYILLGILIEKVTGHDIRAELRRRILRPLGLDDTSLPHYSPVISGPNPRGYEALSGPNRRLTDVTVFNQSWVWTAGAMVSTTSDLNRFYRALLTGELLPAELLRQMQTTITLPVTGTEYGLGLLRVQLPDVPGCPAVTLWGHDGIVPGFRTLTLTSADGKRQLSVSVTKGLTSIMLDRRVGVAISRMLLTAFCEQPPGVQSARPPMGAQRVRPLPLGVETGTRTGCQPRCSR